LANLKKHDVDFADSVGVFEDPLAISIPDDRHGEPRSVTIGTDFLGRLLVVVYAWRGQRIRIISACEATPGERRHYEG
jgi:uncharacterized DUF497 family protein